MTTLSFTDFSLEISDLPIRAKGLGEEQTVDVLGGFGRSRWGRRSKSRRHAMIKAMARRRSAQRRARSKKPSRSSIKRRRGSSAARSGLMRKAAYHGRMASMFRSRAARA